MLTDTMVTYWTNFAHNSNPNIGQQVPVQWPLFTVNARQNIHLQTPSVQVESHYLGQQCDMWDTVGYFW